MREPYGKTLPGAPSSPAAPAGHNGPATSCRRSRPSAPGPPPAALYRPPSPSHWPPPRRFRPGPRADWSVGVLGGGRFITDARVPLAGGGAGGGTSRVQWLGHLSLRRWTVIGGGGLGAGLWAGSSGGAGGAAAMTERDLSARRAGRCGVRLSLRCIFSLPPLPAATVIARGVGDATWGAAPAAGHGCSSVTRSSVVLRTKDPSRLPISRVVYPLLVT